MEEENELENDEAESQPGELTRKIKPFMRELLDEMVTRATEIPGASISGMLATEEILEKLLERTDKNIMLKEGYNRKCQSHNQAPLFNMLKIILDFDIDEEMVEKLTFRESLFIGCKFSSYELNQTPCGGICIDVQKVVGSQPFAREMEEYEAKLMKLLDADGSVDHMCGGSQVKTNHGLFPEYPEDDLELQRSYGWGKFLVHVSSQFDVDGNNGGSTITSWVDKNLHTLEELRKEFIVEERDKSVNEKSLYTALKKHWYYIKHTSTYESIDNRKLYSLRKAKDFVSEGASIILMRYLAVSKYFGQFELAAAYINGDLCRNIYYCDGPISQEVNGKRMDACNIERTVIEECGITHKCKALLSLDGQLLKLEWDDSDYMLYVNPKANLKNEKPSCSEELLLKDNWETDMQLMSLYLDKKGSSLMKNRTYMVDHPELRAILCDYVNMILQMRPPDIFNFTMAYFGEFAEPHALPRNDYFDHS